MNLLRASNTARWLAPLVAIAILCAVAPARAQVLLKEHPAKTLGTELIDKRGDSIPLDLAFTDAQGRTVRIGDFFDGRTPVVLILGYFDCPLLCTLVFNGAQRGFNELSHTLGKEFRAVSVSIDHTNTTSQAAGRQAAMLAGYNRNVPDESWAFLTGDAASVRRLADSVGYTYVYLPKSGEFSHPAAIIILTPSGKVSSYLQGVQFPGKQLRLALIDATEGRAGGVFDRLLLYCYHYDPSAGAYTLQAVRVMQVGGALTVLLLGGSIAWLFWSGSRRRARVARAAVLAGPPSSPALARG